MKRNYQRIFIHNLNYSENDKSIRSHFGKVGNIKDVQIPRDPKNKTKGFAFVTYENAEHAQLAIQIFHNTMLKGKKICVEYDILNESEIKMQQTLESISDSIQAIHNQMVEQSTKQSNGQWKEKAVDAASRLAENFLIRRFLGNIRF